MTHTRSRAFEDLRGKVATIRDPITGSEGVLEYVCAMTAERLAADQRRQAIMRSLVELDHPCLPKVRAFPIHRGHLGVLIEAPHAHGPLGALGRVGHRKSANDIRRWGVDIAQALGAAHAVGLFHGMLASERILIGGETRSPLILGLGVAQLRFDPSDARSLDRMRRPGEPIPRFLPPRLSATEDMRAYFLMMAKMAGALQSNEPSPNEGLPS